MNNFQILVIGLGIFLNGLSVLLLHTTSNVIELSVSIAMIISITLLCIALYKELKED